MFVAQLYEACLQVMKAYVGGSCVATLIPNLGAGWVWVAYITSTGGTSLIPAARRLGGPQRQYGHLGE
jgi:hypothetical protein